MQFVTNFLSRVEPTLTPKIKRDLVDKLQLILRRPIQEISFDGPLGGACTLIVFTDHPRSGEQVDYPQNSCLLFTPYEDVLPIGDREAIVVSFR